MAYMTYLLSVVLGRRFPLIRHLLERYAESETRLSLLWEELLGIVVDFEESSPLHIDRRLDR